MTLLDGLKQVLKDGAIYLLDIIVVIAAACVLGIPILIGLILDSIPVVLFGIMFFAAFGTALAKYAMKRGRKDYIENGGSI